MYRPLALPILFLTLVALLGCEKSPPPVTDPAKAPWLYDPQSQIEGLQNSDIRIRGQSAFNLGNMGEKAVAAVPALEKLAKDDPNEKVREKANEALQKIRGTGAEVSK